MFDFGEVCNLAEDEREADAKTDKARGLLIEQLGQSMKRGSFRRVLKLKGLAPGGKPPQARPGSTSPIGGEHCPPHIGA